MQSIYTNLLYMFSGALVTLELTFLAVFSGFVLAVALTFGKILAPEWIKKTIDVYLFVIRGTPLLAQLFLIYYGLGQFSLLRHSFIWGLLEQPFFCAALALTLNTAAYTCVLLTGAIKSVPQTESMACYALGMTRFQTLWRVIFPQALRSALPAYSNEVIMILQGTALASTVTLLDLMGITQQIIAENYQNMLYLSLAGLIYFAMNFIIIRAFRCFENMTTIKNIVKI